MKIQVENLNFSYGAKRVLNISRAEFEEGNIYDHLITFSFFRRFFL